VEGRDVAIACAACLGGYLELNPRVPGYSRTLLAMTVANWEIHLS
jgi:hypothetical protein